MDVHSTIREDLFFVLCWWDFFFGWYCFGGSLLVPKTTHINLFRFEPVVALSYSSKIQKIGNIF